jgi:O-antigen/teichoic acid export membrane protein
VRAWLLTFATNVAILATGVATGVLAARFLGPEDRGLLAAVQFWPALLASLGFLSLGEAVVYRASRSTLAPRDFAATVLALALGLSLAAAGAGALLLPALVGADRAAWLGTATAYLAAVAAAGFVGHALLSLDQAGQRFRRYNLLRLVPSAIYLAGLLALVALDRLSVATALWAGWAGALAVAVARLGLWRGALAGGRPDRAEAGRLLRDGWRFHGAGSLAILAAQADRLVAVALLDDREVGLYAAAATFAWAGPGVLAQSVNTVLYPRLAAEADPAAAAALLARGLRRTLPVLLAGVALTLAAAPWLVPALFGAAFAPAVPLALALACAAAPAVLVQTLARCLRAFGDARHGMLGEAVTLATFLALAWPLARALGPLGVALAALGGNLAGAALLGTALHRRFGVPWSAWLPPRASTLGELAGDARRLLRPRRARPA